MTKRCEHCDDTLWLCAAHPDRPWGGAPSERACHCGAPAMPCEVCSPCGEPDEPPDGWRAGTTGTPEETPELENGTARARARRMRRRAIEIVRRDRGSGRP